MVITKYNWHDFYCLNLFLNYPNYFDSVKLNVNIIIKGRTNDPIAATELKIYPYWS
jgi:hypothetical protein